MPDEKDKKEEAKAPEGEAKAEAKAEKPAKKAAAKKESKAKAEKKDTAEKKDSKEKPAKKEAKKPAAKKEPKAKKADKAEAKKPAPSRRRRQRDPEELPVVKATAKYVRVAPRKARLIADQVRGMHIEQARALLQFSPRGAAQDIHKLINSAAANAENNHDLVGDEMRITTITVDEGPTLRRFRPRALGRATPINKRTSHISVALTPVEDD
ncbi:MAG: 50S ribosomal protein L22 [Actinobacteria bacterium]|nr:50S ribosomal protein L22 [Actinomycetota bacterium]